MSLKWCCRGQMSVFGDSLVLRSQSLSGTVFAIKKKCSNTMPFTTIEFAITELTENLISIAGIYFAGHLILK